jgi:hypothetical protein
MSKNKIFVSIASYRDALCHDTLAHLYKMAKHPERVYAGLCQQNKTGSDKDCIGDSFPFETLRSNIRILRLNFKEARGPTYARYLCSQLYDHEDYFMQIDSHCLFVQDWDEKAIQMIHLVESQTPSKKVVLSHYPVEYQDYKANPPKDEKVTHITQCFFNDDGLLTFKGAQFKKPGPLPRRNAFIAGGFIFARGSFLTEVPFDPHLPFLFTGEELLLSTRSFTNGWDVYTPNMNIIYHAYIRKGEPKFWDDHRLDTDDVHLKVKILTGLTDTSPDKIKNKNVRESMALYGQGTERTLESFYELIGVDPKLKTVSKPTIEFYCACSDMQQQNWLLSIIWVLLIVFSILVSIVLIRLQK